MCGVLAIVGGEEVDPTELLHRMAHRGPDGGGVWVEELGGRRVVLGHRRLSIVGLGADGDQPITSSCGRWVLSFNGEIYNHLQLRDRSGLKCNGGCDAETLVELIAKAGVHKALPALNGMFAFVAVDRVEKKLYAARDPFGIKPMYFGRPVGGLIALASEIHAIRPLLGPESCELDDCGLGMLLMQRYVPSPKTVWRGIERIVPGELLEVDLVSGDRASAIVRPTRPEVGPVDSSVEWYLEGLGRAVERQLMSDVPVGVFLSGGVDSAMIAALAAKSGARPTCYCVGFGDGGAEDEIPDASATARVLGLPFHAVTVSAESIIGVIDDVATRLEEPLGTSSSLPLWFLAEGAGREVKTVLTGQGCDEPWGGYRRYQIECLRGFWPHVAASCVPRSCIRWLESRSDWAGRSVRSLREKSFGARHRHAHGFVPDEMITRLLGSLPCAAVESRLEWWRDEIADAIPGADPTLSVDARTSLADDLLLYGDKITMAHSLEARVPFLDVELMSVVERLPRGLKYRFRKTKMLHKEAAEKLLPPSIVHRPKKGFLVPIAAWLRGPWRSVMRSSLLDQTSPMATYLDIGVLAKCVADHESGRRDWSKQLFCLMLLGIQLRVAREQWHNCSPVVPTVVRQQGGL
jgi:asparagine synthase (glutamine-hydrolysing)